MQIDQLQLWNCFSYYPSVHCFGYLRVKRGKYFGKDKKNYLWSSIYLPLIGLIQKVISWIQNILKFLHEHKCAHILALDNGNYAAQPNNRILWDAPNFTVVTGYS